MATNFLGHFLLAESLLKFNHPTVVIHVTSDMSSTFGSLDVSAPAFLKIHSSFDCTGLYYMNYSYAMSKKALEMYTQYFKTSVNRNRSEMFCANPGLSEPFTNRIFQWLSHFSQVWWTPIFRLIGRNGWKNSWSLLLDELRWSLEKTVYMLC